MNRISVTRKLFTSLILSFFICGIFSISTQAATPKITFNEKKVILFASQSKTLKLKIPKQYKGQKIIFRSSNKTVAKVTKSGILKAKNKGTAKISAQVKGTKKKAKCRVKVLQNIESITVSNTQSKYYVGKQYQLKGNITPVNANETLKWKSSDKQIAKIDKTGLLKIKKPGNVTITAYAQKTKKSYVLNIKTEELPQIRFKEGKKVTVSNGQNIQLNLEFVNRPKLNMTFASLDEATATVSSTGYVTTKKPGEVYITATTPDKKEKIYIKVIIELQEGFITKAMLDNLDLDNCTNLMIVAHPDDESLWGGAHLMQGKWFIVCLTNQSFTVRKNEFKKVLNATGSRGVILDYPDLIKDINGKWQKDNWSGVINGVTRDINTVINYKNWSQIVCHSPTGETGHRHHLMTNKEVLKVCELSGKKNILWYFGTFYKKGQIPANLPKISEEELAFKQNLLNLYVREKPSIKAYWEQMTPYENWVKATDYK